MGTQVTSHYQMNMLKLFMESLNEMPQGSIVKKHQKKKCY